MGWFKMGLKQSKATVVTLDAKMVDEVFTTAEQKSQNSGSIGSSSRATRLPPRVASFSKKKNATVISLSQNTVDEVFSSPSGKKSSEDTSSRSSSSGLSMVSD